MTHNDIAIVDICHYSVYYEANNHLNSLVLYKPAIKEYSMHYEK